MIPATRSQLHDSFERSTYERIGSFIASPDDIIKISLVSHLFQDWVREGAIRAFFMTNHRLIERVGYHTTSASNYENFKKLFLLLKIQYIKTCYAIFNDLPTHFSLNNILKSLTTLELWSRVSFGRTIFPTLKQSYPIFRVMATRRPKESFVETQERIWYWLKSIPYEIQTITLIFSVNINEAFFDQRLSSLPFEITYFSHLQQLTLVGHCLHIVPSFLSRLQRLESLFLRNNQIAEVYCPFKEMPYIKEIDLSKNPLRGNLPSSHLFHTAVPLILHIDANILVSQEMNHDRTPSVFIHFNLDHAATFQDAHFVQLAHHVLENVLVVGRTAIEGSGKRFQAAKLVSAYLGAWTIWKENNCFKEFVRSVLRIQNQAFMLMESQEDLV